MVAQAIAGAIRIPDASNVGTRPSRTRLSSDSRKAAGSVVMLLDTEAEPSLPDPLEAAPAPGPLVGDEELTRAERALPPLLLLVERGYG